MRIATSQIFSTNVATMENQQSQLLQVQQQIASGVAISNPADNPLGAAQAVTLSATSATLTQYASNQSTALTALQLEDTTLTNVTSTMQSINSLIIEAQNGSLTDTARQAIAKQMQGYRDQLMTLANTTDGAGNYIFSGFTSTSQVFSNNSSGGATYNGDSGQRVMQVASTRSISVGDTGATVFQSVQAVGSDIVPSGSTASTPNTGTGVISAVTVTDPTQATNNDKYTINFVTDTATNKLAYTVTDGTGTPSSPVDFTDGDTIDLGTGMKVTITGTPAVGDSFGVSPATASQNTDVFGTIDDIISALNTPASGSPAAAANLNNALNTGLTRIGNSLSNVITVQASVGGREQEVKALQTVTSNNSLQVTSNLTDLTSTDTVAAISQYEQLSNALTASQKSFAATQNLSLFQYINP
ncbi:flagellar hook-associated protein FlgL [Paraburkholderia unamae]|uniref:Flagellar hook-associated protein 3 FlgL n=1 Tax=Paraburkholderia unamae TaxID=219649 RepID=A0ABX5KUW2_9BURK|nr:flagellar hook-associated protein FlgL [Paraburkholderia unamae]PVX97377.1 flagellar hook-associated protein 3 FlgL [Paraburkholderia unamae]CAG9253825.1 Flagellar hook-associated protein flgL [Paraburkholderia unamae]